MGDLHNFVLGRCTVNGRFYPECIVWVMMDDMTDFAHRGSYVADYVWDDETMVICVGI